MGGEDRITRLYKQKKGKQIHAFYGKECCVFNLWDKKFGLSICTDRTELIKEVSDLDIQILIARGHLSDPLPATKKGGFYLYSEGEGPHSKCYTTK